ncbi:superoxide dismutase [Cu-Zn], chloroplastic-like [Telopea speciosissima]|uniref:superoxide dismutase [Cu-Zn], chloroplastic-like n=1 Tax=Telopea speciosissima TaxID=54955 RepID=UPI001CC4B909|nr:superoxide dismutase [Cu-Zn], chloroplastic-like [Telopea speciosissima]
MAVASRPLTIVAETKKAVAVLKGNSQVEGVVTLTQEDDKVMSDCSTTGPMTVNVRVTGLTPGPHGFHLVFPPFSRLGFLAITWFNKLSEDSGDFEVWKCRLVPCVNESVLRFSFPLLLLFVDQLGAHFNPNNMTHSAPEDEVRHAGDLGNIVANVNTGVAEATIVDNQVPFIGSNAVIGRAFVVHELKDDLGKGGHELSLTTGNVGGKLACGVVGLTPVQ